jgi:DnaK suppressor protein
MTPEQLDHFRQRLLEERERLNERILAAEERARQEIDPGTGTDDRPERTDLADTSLRLGTLFTEQQHEIDDALLRIELGEYGLCEICGDPIELERLEAQPAARFCMVHAPKADVRRPPKL